MEVKFRISIDFYNIGPPISSFCCCLNCLQLPLYESSESNPSFCWINNLSQIQKFRVVVFAVVVVGVVAVVVDVIVVDAVFFPFVSSRLLPLLLLPWVHPDFLSIRSYIQCIWCTLYLGTMDKPYLFSLYWHLFPRLAHRFGGKDNFCL